MIKLKPDFWYDSGKNPETFGDINFKRKWKMIVSATITLVLLPLFIMMLIDANLTRHSLENQMISALSHTAEVIVESISLNLEQNHRSDSFSDPSASTIEHRRINAAMKSIKNFSFNDATDLFLVSRKGLLLTDSIFLGTALEKTAPVVSDMITGPKGVLHRIETRNSGAVTGVYIKIPETSVFIIMLKQKKAFSELYLKPRLELAGYLVISIFVIILSILWTTTYLIGRIHIADKKRIDALHHAESANKLAAIGRLASGVAHEINNPLAIINEKNGLLLDLMAADGSLDNKTRLSALANDVTDAVERCSTITRRLLDFARHMEPSNQPVSVPVVIRQILDFLEKEAQKLNIKISVIIPDGLPALETDRGSLQQIFLNLIENAFDAMPGGGRLTVTALLKPAGTMTIEIEDTGIGIPADELHKIFEPFYTSKQSRWKSGLGLSIVYGLIKEIEGEIKVKSFKGKGTRFTVTLPLVNKLTTDITPDTNG